MTTTQTPTPTAPSFVTVPKDFNRETRFGRPLIIPPGGGKPKPYRRTTTYVGVLEDMYNLQRWEKRMVALGLAERNDLLLGVQAADPGDKRGLDQLCDAAKEVAKASANATIGTALHKLTDKVDRGEDLPPVAAGPAASIAAFRDATRDLTPVAIEQQLVLDIHDVAGTADRIYEYQGERYIGDTKSGNIELGILKICMQLAVYARSWAYDVDTGQRWTHGASTSRAIVMHMPATDDPAQARCELVWVDIERGWHAVQVAAQVWEQRKLKYADLSAPFGPVPEPDNPAAPPPRTPGMPRNSPMARERARVASQIDACTSRAEVEAVWARNEQIWNSDLTARARAVLAQVEAA